MGREVEAEVSEGAWRIGGLGSLYINTGLSIVELRCWMAWQPHQCFRAGSRGGY